MGGGAVWAEVDPAQEITVSDASGAEENIVTGNQIISCQYPV